MKLSSSLVGGFSGALVLNGVHESARYYYEDAPHVHRLAMSGVARGFEEAGRKPPGDDALYGLALAGDLVSNTAYYSLVGLGSREGAVARGAALGFAGGLVTVLLPVVTGLDREPVARTLPTAVLTVVWYTFGGIIAGLVAYLLDRTEQDDSKADGTWEAGAGQGCC